MICDGNIINLFINMEGNDSVIKTTTEKVKKEKNPMRVEQGRKMAEWNMKNKRGRASGALREINENINFYETRDVQYVSPSGVYGVVGGLAFGGILVFLLYNYYKNNSNNNTGNSDKKVNIPEKPTVIINESKSITPQKKRKRPESIF